MVDKLLIERILSDLQTHVNELKKADDITWEIYRSDTRSRRFVERTIHISIEACIDIAHHIIADERLREPYSYKDAFAVLAENGILHEDDRSVLESMASFRNILVHYYERIDDSLVFGFFRNNLSDFDRFIDRIIVYLKKQGA